MVIKIAKKKKILIILFIVLIVCSFSVGFWIGKEKEIEKEISSSHYYGHSSPLIMDSDQSIKLVGVE